MVPNITHWAFEKVVMSLYSMYFFIFYFIPEVRKALFKRSTHTWSPREAALNWKRRQCGLFGGWLAARSLSLLWKHIWFNAIRLYTFQKGFTWVIASCDHTSHRFIGFCARAFYEAFIFKCCNKFYKVWNHPFFDEWKALFPLFSFLSRSPSCVYPTFSLCEFGAGPLWRDAD